MSAHDGLTPRAADVFRAILAHAVANGGTTPTIREIGRAVRIGSTSVVNYHLKRLVDAGLISRIPGEARGIVIVGACLVLPPHAERFLEGRAA